MINKAFTVFSGILSLLSFSLLEKRREIKHFEYAKFHNRITRIAIYPSFLVDTASMYVARYRLSLVYLLYKFTSGFNLQRIITAARV